MEITDVRIILRNDDRLKAYGTITLDHCFVVRRLRVIQAGERLFVAMPARRKSDGTFQDIAHPINADTRAHLEERVIAEYLRELRRAGATHCGAQPLYGHEPDRADDERV
jgi:stage V sporulation protein G